MKRDCGEFLKRLLQPLPPDSFVRLPGLYYHWEFEQLIEPNIDFRFVEGLRAEDGSQLYMIYRREPKQEEE